MSVTHERCYITEQFEQEDAQLVVEFHLLEQLGHQSQQLLDERQARLALLLLADSASERQERLRMLQVGDGLGVVGEVGKGGDGGELLVDGGEDGLEAGAVAGGLR